ncbi:MAG: hypothetical protein M3138_07500, partial [Actinomycetota bacterium]|nr:hypothetical protein [Actinomycetota bacterium]
TAEIAGGILSVTTPETGTLTADIAVDDGTLLISGAEGRLALEVDLPAIARGMTYESVELRGSSAVLEMSFRDSVFTPT